MTNADKALPAYEVEWQGEKKEFVLDFKALCQAEKKLGRSLFKAINWNELGFSDWAIFMWAGLLRGMPDLKFEDFSDRMDLKLFQLWLPVAQQAVTAAMPTDAEKKMETPEETAAETPEAVAT